MMNYEAELCPVLGASLTKHGLPERIQCNGPVVQALREAAADIGPLLTVEVHQVPTDGSAVLLIAISCSQELDGIEAMRALVAAAAAMPPTSWGALHRGIKPHPAGSRPCR